MRRLMSALLIMTAACSSAPPAQRPVQAPVRAADRGGCPAASRVFLVERATTTRWRLPLRFESGGVASEADVEEADPSAYEERVISAADARAHGVSAPPPTLWIYVDGAPCRATTGAPFAHTTNTEGDVETVYGVQLASSCPPGERETAFALAAEAAPAGCTFVAPKEVAARRGRVTKAGRRRTTYSWTPPATAAALPPALGRGLPEKPCAPPGCEQLYVVERAGGPDRAAAWQVTLTWLRVGAPDAYCTWAADDHLGIYVEGGDGAVHLVAQPRDRKPPHRLAGVFSDDTGPRVVVLQEAGWYGSFDVDASGGAHPAKDVQWHTPHVMDVPSWAGFAPRCDDP